MIPTKDTVTVTTRGTLDDWGRPVNAGTATYNCRIDYANEEIKLENGSVVVSRVIILIKGLALVTTNDLVEWEDEFGEHAIRPISVSPLKDLSSKVIFTKVVF